VPGAGRKPVEPAADKPAAAVEAAGAVAVALARNPGEPAGADSPEAAVAVRTEVAEAHTPGELVAGALDRHIPVQPVGVQGRYFVSRSRSKHCRTGTASCRQD
jgi:hypothetical protein